MALIQNKIRFNPKDIKDIIRETEKETAIYVYNLVKEALFNHEQYVQDQILPRVEADIKDRFHLNNFN